MEVPSFRFLLAQERRLLKNILIRTPFALGDCICAEPAIRFAQKNFEGSTISLTTPFPDLYRHIPNIKKIYNVAKGEKPNWDDYYVFECYHAAEALQSEFVHNFNMAIEDYISVSLFKGMIPVKDRNIVLCPTELESQAFPPQEVVIHAGKHWVAKSFPKKWWDEVISELFELGITPTLVGARVDDGKRGYVEVNSEGCVDLRDKLSIMQSVAVLQRAKVVLTNDSAPYHMACSTKGEIAESYVGVFSTIRNFDFIGHWRPSDFGNQWNHRVENLAKGQMWQDTDVTPARNGGKYDVCNYETIMSWLPSPEFVAAWVQQKLRSRTYFKTVVASQSFEQSR
jgi:hypothetical protein